MQMTLAAFSAASLLLSAAAVPQVEEQSETCRSLKFEMLMLETELFDDSQHQALRDTSPFSTWFALTHELAAINPPHEVPMPPRWRALVPRLEEVERILVNCPMFAQVKALDACHALEETTERWRNECTTGARIPAPCIGLSGLLGPIWHGSFPEAAR